MFADAVWPNSIHSTKEKMHVVCSEPRLQMKLHNLILANVSRNNYDSFHMWFWNSFLARTIQTFFIMTKIKTTKLSYVRLGWEAGKRLPNLIECDHFSEKHSGNIDRYYVNIT